MARKQTRKDKTALRTDMIEHAEKMIQRGGFASLTARALAKEMHIALGTTYNLFSSLDELVFLVNLRTLDRLSHALAKVHMRDVEVEQGLMNYADCYVRFVEENRPLWSGVFQLHQVEVDPALMERARRQVTQLFQVLEDVLVELVPDEEERRLSARTLWVAVHGILSLAGEQQPSLTGIDDVRRTIHHLVRCQLAGLRSLKVD